MDLIHVPLEICANTLALGSRIARPCPPSSSADFSFTHVRKSGRHLILNIARALMMTSMAHCLGAYLLAEIVTDQPGLSLQRLTTERDLVE